MKIRNLFFVVAFCTATFSFSQQKREASVFFGVAYQLINNSDSGINAGFEYMFLDNTSFAPSLSYYFSANGIKTYSVNADVRYYLNSSSKVRYYGIGGFSYLIVKSTITNIKTESLGINAGGGLLFSLSENLSLLGQVKYDSSGAASIEPMVGLSLSF